ncbi:hypothetical protein K438DRAFT_1717034 [Mycena galopus ATCC 62051]|nr:hypothetical protein K438DRAFT_1717034 [Mycena galopus ATCC 62051]
MAIEWPQELIDHVIDQLAVDADSLKSCSLVCRAWVPRCRSHLFKSCSLHTKDIDRHGVHNILSFRDLLRSSYCTFVPHVRCLRTTQRAWDIHDSLYQEIAVDLRRLTSVIELVMKISIYHQHADLFFSAGFFMSFPQITQLRLNCRLYQNGHLSVFRAPVPIPIIDLISLFPALQELEVSGSEHSTWADPRAGALPPKGLRVLVLVSRPSCSILAWLYAANSLRNVHSLKLHDGDPPTVRAALQQIGDSLRDLDISLDPLSDRDGMFDFSLHPSLEAVSIRWWTAPTAVMGLIRRLAGLPLRRLLLEVHAKLFQVPDWEELDAFFSPARFPLLRSVTFRFYRGYEQHEIIRSRLPMLEASGRLLVKEF